LTFFSKNNDVTIGFKFDLYILPLNLDFKKIISEFMTTASIMMIFFFSRTHMRVVHHYIKKDKIGITTPETV
jgi:hypothetical protein